jgi:phosphoribosylformimino-5-aminoimidazole carboxamide ribotide isomerase
VIVAPAIDLRSGRCVQLVGGRPDDERVSLPDPVKQAGRWWDLGFRTLHVVDLDAALSVGDNRSVIGEIAASTKALLQVGGGVRDQASMATLLAMGVQRVIAGTRAVDDPEWLEEVAVRHPGRILVAADVREGRVLRKGWTESSGVGVLEFLRRLDRLPLAGILCTDVGREGRMAGVNLPWAEEMVAGSLHPLWISGGITTMKELRALAGAGAAGAVLGMAIYTGVLPPENVAKEFGG